MPAHTHCRICHSALPAPFLDLGRMPLANSFLASPAEFAAEETFPLAVAGCLDCGLVQLNFTVPAERLYRDYIYVSSTSEGVTTHAAALAERLIAQYGWTSADLIVEVASNDGTVLKAFKRQGLRVLGVEPARNIAAIAEAEGIPTLAEFFDPDSAETVRQEHGLASAILGRHVFAHVDDVHRFLDGVDRALSSDGVFIIEVPYLGDFLDKLEFDTVYHEHLSYVSLQPMVRLCQLHGFELTDVERGSLHGGVIILHMRRSGVASPSQRLTTMLEAEQAQSLSSADRLQRFAAGVKTWKEQFEGLIETLVSSGQRLIGYGAAAKGNTLLNYCPAAANAMTTVLDRSPHKHGRYTPGTHLRVEPADYWASTDASHMLILAWNFQAEIMRQMRPFAERGGRFVVPIPVPKIV